MRNVPTMPLEEISTITAKGQTTVPKSVRNALGLKSGEKIVFRIEGGQVIVSKREPAHRDPAMASFLKLIEKDIKAGRNVRDLPKGVTAALDRAMRAVDVDLDETLTGDVAL